ncbi:MAG: glycosyltransferase family 1 [Patescibacteria group bacterium]|nr:MAG: glycosyltransferase family 1 [Patescibacteria group bacterium]
MRIIYLLFNTKKNGGNKVILDQVSQLISFGHNVEVITILGKSFHWYNQKVITKKISIKNFFTRYDYLICTFWPTAYIGLFLPAKKKSYFIQALEENFSNNYIYKFLVRLTYKLPYKFIVTTQFLKKSLLTYGIPKKNISIINNITIDPHFFQKKHRRINKRRIKILTVMSYYLPYKGPDIYLQILKMLKQNYPIYTTLVSMERYSLSPLVDKFISNPSAQQLARLYLSHDILLVTSRSEGFFLPGIEAMAAGCLVISTNSGGILTYAKHNYNAYIFKDIDQIINIFDELLHNHQLETRIRNNAYRTAEKYRTISSSDVLKRTFSL